MDDERNRFETRVVEAGRRKQWTQGIVNPPVFRASTILFDNVAAMRAAGAGEVGTLHYGRSGTPTQWSLAEALTELEPGAAGTRLFASGVAATGCALLSVLKPGDQLLMVDSVYGPTRTLCDTLLKRMGIATVYYDPSIGAGIEALVGPTTRAIFLESPGSLTFEVQDVPAICSVAKRLGLTTLIDNSWATPLLFGAIAAGVDLAILACTKYIVGHSDVMLGSVTAADSHWKALEQTSRALGQHVSPDDAFLAARGLRTLAVRLRQHEASALNIAQWLANQPQVARVLHPALPSCPGHDLWARDFRGSSGLFAIEMAGGDDVQVAALIDGLDHFGIGYSWGGFESLALPVMLGGVRILSGPDRGPMIRLHIGLENTDDLIADLARGLDRYGLAPTDALGLNVRARHDG